MLMMIFELRARMLAIYQKIRFVLNPLVKFILSWLVFAQINGEIGYDARFTKTVVVLLLSVICAVTPGGVLVFFSMVLTLVHIYFVSPFLAIIVLLAYIVLYGLLMRFTPKQAIVAVAIPVLAKYNLHYAVPITLGAVSNPLSVLASVCGVFIMHMLEIIKAAAARQVSLSLDDIIQLYTDVADAIIGNKAMFAAMVVFAMVTVVVYVLRKFSFGYSFEISVAAGVVVNILGFLIADLRFNLTANIGVLIIMSLVSGVVAILIQFSKRVLDYTAVERVQFEDDDYYYYVKAVPKINVSIPKFDVKHINSAEDSEADESDEYDEYDESGEYEDYETEEVYEEYDDFGKADSAPDTQEVYEDYEEPKFDIYTDLGQIRTPFDSENDYEVEMTLDDEEK